MKVERAQAGDFRKAREIGLLGVARIQMANDPRDALVIVHGSILPRQGPAFPPDSCGVPGPVTALCAPAHSV